MNSINTKKLIGLLAVILLCITSVFIGFTIANYSKGVESANNLQESMDVEIIRVDAFDGVPLKALFLSPNNSKLLPNDSIPLAFVCHGMSVHYFQGSSLMSTLVSNGYAVISPEFRGHQSNPAPISLGSNEPWDIITLLDYAEENFPFINISNSGIFGESMGALYATGAYMFESLGKNRFKALVSVNGPINISREIDFLTNQREGLGDIPFTNNLTLKNPINIANSTFPKNMMAIHGTEDIIVSYECTKDFISKIDPDGTREDVVFHTMVGAGHSSSNEHYRNATSWFSKYIKGVEINPDDVIITGLNFRDTYADDFKKNLLYSCISLIFLLGFGLYLIKPHYFDSYDGISSNSDENQDNSSALNENSMKKIDKKIDLGIYFGLQLLGCLIALFIHIYIILELLISAIISLIFLLYLCKKGGNSSIELVNKSINMKAAISWSIIIVISSSIYVFIPSLDIIENQLLVPGVRISWYPIFITLVLTAIFASIFLLNRLIFNFNERDAIGKFKMALTNGFLTIITIMLFYLAGFDYGRFFWGWFATIFGFPVIPLFAIGLGIFCIPFTYFVTYFEKKFKTILLPIIMFSMLIAFVAGLTSLILIY